MTKHDNDHVNQAKAIMANLGQYAKQRGLTQTAIAQRAGVPQSQMNRTLNGKHDTRLSTFLAIAAACDLTPEEAIAVEVEVPKTITVGGRTYRLEEDGE